MERRDYRVPSVDLPELGWGAEGDIYRKTWIFRGHKSATYNLEPSIEREAGGTRLSWKALESELLKEFQTKAPLHISSDRLPHSNDKLSWLPLMQHYGVPTRLLDFTYSPYAALYFALRDRPKDKPTSPPEVWAVDQVAVNSVASGRSRNADQDYAKEHPEPTAKTVGQRRARSLLDQRFFAREYEILEGEDRGWNTIVSKALEPDEIRRDFFDNNGLVLSALPRVESQRLSSQQGLFLLSGAEKLMFEESLERMMSGCRGWCRRFQFAEELLPEVEARLFQMNIHDLSLFPDVEGLAGFVRQKVRLLWRKR